MKSSSENFLRLHCFSWTFPHHTRWGSVFIYSVFPSFLLPSLHPRGNSFRIILWLHKQNYTQRRTPKSNAWASAEVITRLRENRSSETEGFQRKSLRNQEFCWKQETEFLENNHWETEDYGKTLNILKQQSFWKKKVWETKFIPRKYWKNIDFDERSLRKQAFRDTELQKESKMVPLKLNAQIRG